MLMNDTIFMCSEDREIRSDFESHVGDRVAGRSLFDEPDDARIVDVFVWSKIHQLIRSPLAHLVPGMNEVTLPDRPFDRVARLDDVKHVDGRIEDSLQVECIFDNAFGMTREIGGDEALCYFMQADLVRVRLTGRYR